MCHRGVETVRRNIGVATNYLRVFLFKGFEQASKPSILRDNVTVEEKQKILLGVQQAFVLEFIVSLALG